MIKQLPWFDSRWIGNQTWCKRTCESKNDEKMVVERIREYSVLVFVKMISEKGLGLTMIRVSLITLCIPKYHNLQ